MPTLPAHVLPRVDPRVREVTKSSSGKVELSKTALAFLLPLFITFIFGPILLVYYIRRRRRTTVTQQPHERGRSAAERREEARKKLDEVTDVIKVTEGKYACHGVAEGEKEEDNSSVFERDCSICLSSLYAPSPPEPAKLNLEGGPVDDAARAPSVSENALSEEWEILRLKVCSHEFHVECLVSWFVLSKFSCPICRAVYYGKKEDKEEGEASDSASTEMEELRSGESNQRREEV